MEHQPPVEETSTQPVEQPKAPEAEKPVVSLKISKKPLIIGGVIALLLIAGGVFAFTSRGNNSEKDKGKEQISEQEREAIERDKGRSTTPETTADTTSENRFFAENSEGCVEQDASFTSAPLPEGQLGWIEPMGKVLDGHVTPTDHVYVHPLNSRAADNTYDVVMPAKGTVVAISAMPASYVGDRQQETAVEDHRLVIAHNCQYFSIFIHVHKLSPALSAVVGKLDPSTSKKVSIPLEAGAKLGMVGGSAFDWSLIDTKTTLTGFISPELYDGEPWKIHAIDPLSLYSGAVKTKLEALSMRSAAPFGGKIDNDKAGALVGNWFREGTGGYSSNNKDSSGRYWDGHLSVAPDYVDDSSTVVSIGNWTNDTAAQYIVKGSADPSAVTKATGPVKYELAAISYVQPSGAEWTGNEKFVKGVKPIAKGASVGTIMMEVLDGEKIKVEKFPGKTPAQVTAFTSAAQTYER
ncbi:MAG TPA: hypothetical protein VLA04_01875 [Verrucomicrobiae bacterium]|nr:hypothetical protein [Verrucomicrobiae bacterium]